MEEELLILQSGCEGKEKQLKKPCNSGSMQLYKGYHSSKKIFTV
jgi:hypothetical protein